MFHNSCPNFQIHQENWWRSTFIFSYYSSISIVEIFWKCYLLVQVMRKLYSHLLVTKSPKKYKKYNIPILQRPRAMITIQNHTLTCICLFDFKPRVSSGTGNQSFDISSCHITSGYRRNTYLDQKRFKELVRHFGDSFDHPFSLQHLLKIGKEHLNKAYGEWYGPSTVAYVLRWAALLDEKYLIKIILERHDCIIK